MNFDANKLYDLLPAIDRIRDIEQGGPLKALLTVIAEQAAVLEENLAQKYDDHFIETCADWVAPYIGDLIGYRGVYNSDAVRKVVPGVSSPRAEVANTIGYRRRKGTLVALEQIARDVTGWNAHVVEFFQRLATTQYMNHLRPDNRSPYVGGLTRDILTGDLSEVERPLWEPLERLGTPFETLAHTLDVRRISPRRGRYNIPNIGIFLWRLNSYPLTAPRPFQLDGWRYFFSPLGNNTTLFTWPQTLPEFSGLSTRMNVPDPISRCTLDTYLQDYYGVGKSILVSRDGQAAGVEEITVCDLSDAAGGGWAHQPVDKIAIDPVLGRIAFPSSQPAPKAEEVSVRFHYGFSADMGGGEYDRDSSVPADSIFRQSDVWQIGVTNTLPSGTSRAVDTFGKAVSDWNAQPAGTIGVIAVMDSGTYDTEIATTGDIIIPDGSKLLIIAAGWPEEAGAAGQFNATGCRPHLRGNLSVTGKGSGEIHLNGLLIEGALQISGASPDDSFGRVSLCHCTLVPGLGLTPDNLPKCPCEASVKLSVSDISLEMGHSITGGLRVSETTTTRITNSIVDATSRCRVAFSGLDGHAAGGTLHVENSTLIGKVGTALMELATNTIFFARLAAHDFWTAPVWCEQRQAGCMRFSYVPPGSLTPRRYRCQPASDDDVTRVAPQFRSLLYGEPAYAQLSRRCPAEIFNGADDESEMGAFHDLYEPQRITNLTVRLDEYLRFGLEAGIFFEPQIESRPPAASAYGYGAMTSWCGDAMEQPEQLPGIGAGLI
jgi:hypothetical protein